MASNRYLRGSTAQCPKCGSRRVSHDPILELKGYGPGLAACGNCRTLWEPFPAEAVWDRSDPACSFREPCNNCAFRAGSQEQQDRERWKALIGSLKAGGSFYCHKGVPIEPDAEHGFAYPEDRSRLRLCRGYLNALGGMWKAQERPE